MPFDVQQFKEYLALELERLYERDRANEGEIHVLAAKLVETDKAAVELRTLYTSDHMPKQEIERRITRLEINQVIYIGIGSLVGAAIVTGIVKLLGW